MSYLEPVADADHHYAKRDAADAAQAEAEQAMAQEFLTACRKLDANALAAFAPLVKDYETARKLQCASSDVPRRFQALTEVMNESLDYANGPGMTELMQLLLNVAFCPNLVNQPAAARALLERMAKAFATHNAGAA